MKIRQMTPYLCAFVILAILIAAVGGRNRQITEPEKPAESNETKASEEMRGIWVTYMTLDVENEADKENAFIEKIDRIVRDAKDGGFNTLFVQVRPFCDAIYRSAYYPWSHIISGTQGKDPGFDPLKIICNKCRESDLSLHAWINPYRVSTSGSPPKLSADNPYTADPSIGFELNGERYLKPQSEKARTLIVSGVIELLENYEIDGIHFDDYFYPEGYGDLDAQDYDAYRKSTASPLSLEKYRMECVSTLVREVYRAVHEVKPNAVFGISPQGNIENNAVLYADVRRWCKEEGYLDYICPQLYFSLDNPALSFEDGLKGWLGTERHPELKLYAGLAGYKAGTDADEGTWTDNSDILKTEVEILLQSGADGFLYYSYDSLNNENNRAEAENLIRYLTTSPSQ
jgi:uncharacterized lipoprotein YddW (UPF0748 family)